MKKIFLIFFIIILFSGCENEITPPVQESEKIIFKLEKGEYLYDTEWTAYIINNSDSITYLPACRQTLYGVDELKNNRWQEVESLSGSCIPGSQELKKLNKQDTLIIIGRARPPGTYRLKTVYNFLQNTNYDTIYSNTFVINNNPTVPLPEDQKVLIKLEKEFYNIMDNWSAWITNEAGSNLYFYYCVSFMYGIEKLQDENWIMFNDGARTCTSSSFLESTPNSKHLIEGFIDRTYTAGKYRVVMSYWNNPSDLPESKHIIYSNTFEVK